jgi:hypothetical protein
MAHVIGAKLHLVTVFGEAWWDCHDAGIGEKDVELVEVGQKLFGGGCDRLE